jgi:predicted RNase H-like nuclease
LLQKATRETRGDFSLIIGAYFDQSLRRGRAMKVTIIGIDCATASEKVGLARSLMEEPGPRVVEARTGSRGQKVAELIKPWTESGPTLLALDAPLGWPYKLGQVLYHHSAGMPINECPDDIFRRLTDRIVEEKIGQRPLDVGADRIARTAHAALTLLQELREITSQEIPLAWDPVLKDQLSAIEVYPAATLKAHGILSSGYKKKTQEEARKEIVNDLGKLLDLPGDHSLLLSNADALDAVICVLAAVDFLSGEAIRPADRQLAEKEGWIWVRRKGGNP